LALHTLEAGRALKPSGALDTDAGCPLNTSGPCDSCSTLNSSDALDSGVALNARCANIGVDVIFGRSVTRVGRGTNVNDFATTKVEFSTLNDYGVCHFLKITAIAPNDAAN
jgi:hypothetical protein